MLDEILDSNLNPFFVRVQEVTYETPDYDGGDEHVPEVNMPLLGGF